MRLIFNFYTYALFRGISLGMYVPISLVFLNECHCPPFHIGTLGTVFELTKFLTEMPTARLTDKYGAKIPLICSSILASMLWPLFFLSNGVLSVAYICMAVLGISESLITGSLEAWMAVSVDKNKLSSTLLSVSKITLISSVASAALSGWLYNESVWICLIIITATSIGKAVVVYLSDIESASIPHNYIPISKAIKACSLYVWKNLMLRTILLSIFFVTMACDMVLRYYQLYLDHHGFKQEFTGYVFSCAGVVAWLIMSVLTHFDKVMNRFPILLIVCVDVVGSVLCFILAKGGPSSHLILSSLILLLSLEDLRSPLIKSIVSKNLYGFHYKAMVFSLFAVVESGGEILAGTLFGCIVKMYDLHMGFLISVLLFFISAVFCALGALLYRKRVKVCVEDP